MQYDAYGNPVPDPYDQAAPVPYGQSMGGSAGGVGAPYTPNVPAYPGGSPDLSNQTSGGGIASTIAGAQNERNAKLRTALAPEDFKTGAKLSGETPEVPAPAGNPAPTFAPFKRGPEVPAASPTSGMGGGGGIDRAPLTAAEQEEQDAILRSGELNKQLGQQKTQQATEMVKANEEFARRKFEDAEDQKLVDWTAASEQKRFLAEQERLANDLANKRIDPSRLLRNADTQTQFTIGVGAIIAGGLAAMNNKDGNSSLDRLDKIIDRDIDAQKQDIESGRASYNARNSLFSQMLAQTKDANLATMATRALIYDATAEKLKVDAARLGIPQIQTTADIAAQKFTEQSATLKREVAQQSYKQKLAAAASAVAGARAAEQQRITNALNERKMRVEEGKLAVDQATAGGTAAADASSRFVPLGKDASGNPTGYVAATAEEAKEKKKSHEAAQKVLGLIDNSLAIREQQGAIGRFANRETPFWVPEWQTQLRSNKGELTTAWKETGHLGTLDKGTEKLADQVIGELESAGGSSEERLRQLRANIVRNIEKDTEGAGGQQAYRTIDPATGRAVVVVKPKINAPDPAYAQQTK